MKTRHGRGIAWAALALLGALAEPAHSGEREAIMKRYGTATVYARPLQNIEVGRLRKIPHADFARFLQGVLYISDNRHQSGRLLLQMIGELQVTGERAAGGNLLYAAAFANDNPAVLQAMVQHCSISRVDKVDVLQQLFQTHALVYTDAYLASEDFQPVPGCGDWAPFPRPPRLHMLERKNGVQMAKVMRDAGFPFVHPEKYLLMLKNPELIGKRHRLQENAHVLLEFIQGLSR